jgi:hypothetical protein
VLGCRSWCAVEAKVLGWRDDENPKQSLAKIGTKVAQIAGDEVRAASFDGGQKDEDIFFGEADALWQLAGRGIKEIQERGKANEPVTLSILREVDAGLFQCIVGSAKHDLGQTPKPQETCIGAIGDGEKDIGIKKEPVHAGSLLWRAMGNGDGVETEFFYCAAGTAVVSRVCGVGKKKFGFTLRRIFFDGDDGGRSKQDAVVAGLRGDEGALVETEAFAELRRHDDGAPFADLCGIHGKPHCLIIRISDIQTQVEVAAERSKNEETIADGSCFHRGGVHSRGLWGVGVCAST